MADRVCTLILSSDRSAIDIEIENKQVCFGVVSGISAAAKATRAMVLPDCL
jgi:hypothetical protein